MTLRGSGHIAFAILIEDTSVQVIPTGVVWTPIGGLWGLDPENTPGVSNIVMVPLPPPEVGMTQAFTQEISQRQSEYKLATEPDASNAGQADTWEFEVVFARADTGVILRTFGADVTLVSPQADRLTINIFGTANFGEAGSLPNVPQGVLGVFYLRVRVAGTGSDRNLQFKVPNSLGQIRSRDPIAR